MDEKFFLDFEAVAFLENGIGYAAAFETNGLYEVNLNKETCKYITFFPNENMKGKRIYSSAVYCDQKIYFIPMLGKYISIFHIDTHEITQVPVPSPSIKYPFYKQKQKFCKGIFHNGYIYMLPFTYPGILKFDIKTNKIAVIKDWVQNENYFFRGGVCVDGLKIYMPNGIDNMILEFNINTERVSIRRVGIHNNGAMCIRKYKDLYLIAPRLQGSVIIWDPDKDDLHEITKYPDGFETEKIVFSEIICCGDRLLLMPASANMVLFLDINKQELMIQDRWHSVANTMSACMFDTDDDYYFRVYSKSIKEYRRYKIQKKDGKAKEYGFVIENDKEYKKDFFDICMKQNGLIKESEYFKLNDFLKVL